MARHKGPSRRARLEAERRAEQRKQLKQNMLWVGLIAVTVVIGVGAFITLNKPSGGDAAAAGSIAHGAELNQPSRDDAAADGPIAPDFGLTSAAGEAVSLSDYRGQPVAVTFMHTW